MAFKSTSTVALNCISIQHLSSTPVSYTGCVFLVNFVFILVAIWMCDTIIYCIIMKWSSPLFLFPSMNKLMLWFPSPRALFWVCECFMLHYLRAICFVKLLLICFHQLFVRDAVPLSKCATSRQKIMGSIPSLAARSLLAWLLSVQCDRLRQQSLYFSDWQHVKISKASRVVADNGC